MTLHAAVHYAPLFALLITIAFIDVRQRRIPNALTLVVCAGGITQTFWPHSPIGAGATGCGLAAGFGLGLLMLMLGGMGGGDVKLLAAVGAWIGPWLILWVFAASAIAAMVVALVSALRRGQTRVLVSNTGVLASELLLRYRWTGVDNAAANIRDEEKALDPEQIGPFQSVGRPLPFAVAVLIGVVVVVLIIPAVR